jgi:spore coat protein CotH
MRIKVFFWSLVCFFILLAGFIPIDYGFKEDKAAFYLKSENNVTAFEEFFNFFDPYKKHQIEIITTSEELEKLDNYMLENYAKYGVYRNSRNIKGDFIYRQDDEVRYELKNIGFRTNGNGRKLGLIDYDPLYNLVNLNNFKISFNETFSNEIMSNGKRLFLGMDKLNLKFNKTATKEESDVSSYINEVFAYLTYNDAGNLAPFAANVNLILTIDGQQINMGVYTMIENIDKEFLKKRFSKKDNDGNLYKCLYRNGVFADLRLIDDLNFGIKNEEFNVYPTYDLKTNKKRPHFKDLEHFIKQINTLEGNNLKKYLDTRLEVDDFLEYLAITYLIGDIDDFRFRGNNYYLYFASRTNKVYFIPQDLDYVLGQYGDLGSYGSNFALIDAYSDWSLTGQKNILLTKTLLNVENEVFSQYRDLYEHYIDLNIKNNFSYDKYVELFHQVETLYKDVVFTPNVRTKTPPFGIPYEVEKFFENKILKVGELSDHKVSL